MALGSLAGNWEVSGQEAHVQERYLLESHPLDAEMLWEIFSDPVLSRRGRSPFRVHNCQVGGFLGSCKRRRWE